jgi:hypothetical protein
LPFGVFGGITNARSFQDRWATNAGRYGGATAEKAVPFPSLPLIDPTRFFAGRQSGGIMNTAVARRLPLGDRVVWIGMGGYQPAGPGTITRNTAQHGSHMAAGVISDYESPSLKGCTSR